ncbi:DUF982 domain-containing protein [Rhizobium leguminosarum]|uniref:DUF982 domain-containing protein n=1 Tax=Rhizobium leguminosarum TaxID=384 RepID=UPI002FF23324
MRSPQDALYALVSDWPVNGGVHQQRAIDFCRAWLAGRMRPRRCGRPLSWRRWKPGW